MIPLGRTARASERRRLRADRKSRRPVRLPDRLWSSDKRSLYVRRPEEVIPMAPLTDKDPFGFFSPALVGGCSLPPGASFPFSVRASQPFFV